MNQTPLTALANFPAELLSFVAGILVAIMVDPILLALFLGSVAVGLETNAIVAFAVFLLTYVVIRTINTVANAIARVAQVTARNIQPSIPPPGFEAVTIPASDPVPEPN